MKKVVLISGSPRAGNTEYILKKIQNKLGEKSELILLREKKIKHCIGCMKDKEAPFECIFRDDMDEIMESMRNSDLLVIGSPNYYENTPGLLRDFIDRTHPFYSTKEMAGKKILFIFVGGGEIDGTEKHMKKAVQGMVKYLKLEDVGCFSFRALDHKELRERGDESEIDKIVKKINNVTGNR